MIDCEGKSDCDTIYITTISSDVFNFKDANNEKGEEIDVVKTIENYKLYINNETIDINYDLYKIYKDKNINIYKKEDEEKIFYDNVCEINDEYEDISYVLNCIKSNDGDLENGFLKILTEKDPYDSKHVDNNIF